MKLYWLLQIQPYEIEIPLNRLLLIPRQSGFFVLQIGSPVRNFLQVVDSLLTKFQSELLRGIK